MDTAITMDWTGGTGYGKIRWNIFTRLPGQSKRYAAWRDASLNNTLKRMLIGGATAGAVWFALDLCGFEGRWMSIPAIAVSTFVVLSLFPEEADGNE